MKWKIIEERKRKYADESYYLKAELCCTEGTYILEVCWAQIMYALTVEIFKKDSDPELIYDCMVYYEDRIEKYGHQVMRMIESSPVKNLKKLNSFQRDGVLNHELSEKYNVTFKTNLPVRGNA